MCVFDMRHNRSYRSLDARSNQRRELLVDSARACFETNGIDDTSIVDITRAAGVVRELFYYYFTNKSSVRLAVADSYAQEALGLASEWCDTNAQRDWNDQPDVLEALSLAVGYLRGFCFTQKGERKPMFDLLETEHPIMDFFNKVVAEIVRVNHHKPAARGITQVFAGKEPTDKPLHVFELLVMGIIGCMDAMPYVSDEVLAGLALKMFSAQTL